MSEPVDLLPAKETPAATTFRLSPLLVVNLACAMAMMAFVSLIGPIVRVLGLAPWQAGATVTVAGVLWMLLARPWGAASDKRGRRWVLLAGVGGFTLSYWALCAFIDRSLHWLPSGTLAFAGLIIGRAALGAFYAAVPPAGFALIADHVAPERRAGAMASLGAASGAGMVVGPALSALLAQRGLSLPLYATAVLPLVAFIVLWRTLPRSEHPVAATRTELKFSDKRLRRPMAVAFTAMFCISIGQITVGFLALDRLHLQPAEGARVAGIALTAVGVALVLAQLIVRQIGWSPHRLIRVGGVIAALGFGAVAFAASAPMLWACFFVAAAGMGWVVPAFSALAANLVHAREQGAAAGTVSAAQGFGIVTGPLAGSLLYSLSPGVPYLLTGVLLAAMALWPAPETAVSRS